jgi:hypothetical protein
MGRGCGEAAGSKRAKRGGGGGLVSRRKSLPPALAGKPPKRGAPPIVQLEFAFTAPTSEGSQIEFDFML